MERPNGGEKQAWHGRWEALVLRTWPTEDAARRRFAAAAPELVVGAEPVPAIELNRFRSELFLTLLRQPRNHGVDDGVA